MREETSWANSGVLQMTSELKRYRDLEDFPEHLKFLKDEFSNKIPKEILHSAMGRPRFKVRKNWFQGVRFDADILIENNYASEKSTRIYNDFLKYYERTNAKDRLTNKKDIAKANKVLSSLINDLEKQL